MSVMTTPSNQAITDVMTPEPRTVERSEPLSEAYQLLRHAPFHHLVVVEGDEPVGMLATSDILRLVYDIDGTDVRDAAALLAKGSFHSVLVLDDEGTLAGIVTTTDLARFITEVL